MPNPEEYRQYAKLCDELANFQRLLCPPIGRPGVRISCARHRGVVGLSTNPSPPSGSPHSGVASSRAPVSRPCARRIERRRPHRNSRLAIPSCPCRSFRRLFRPGRHHRTSHISLWVERSARWLACTSAYLPQGAMCGRLRVGKEENLHVAGLVGAAMCSAC